MKQFLREIFSNTRKAELTDENIVRILMPSVIGILLCMSCLFGSAWAWFSAGTSVSSQTITAANYWVKVTIPNPVSSRMDASQNETIYELEKDKEYEVALQAGGTASTGYCLVELSDSEDDANAATYYTEAIAPKQEDESSEEAAVSDEDEAKFTFKIIPGENETRVKITAVWGSYAEDDTDTSGSVNRKISESNVIGSGKLPQEITETTQDLAQNIKDTEETLGTEETPSTQEVSNPLEGTQETIQPSEMTQENPSTEETPDTQEKQNPDESKQENPSTEETPDTQDKSNEEETLDTQDKSNEEKTPDAQQNTGDVINPTENTDEPTQSEENTKEVPDTKETLGTQEVLPSTEDATKPTENTTEVTNPKQPTEENSSTQEVLDTKEISGTQDGTYLTQPMENMPEMTQPEENTPEISQPEQTVQQTILQQTEDAQSVENKNTEEAMQAAEITEKKESEENEMTMYYPMLVDITDGEGQTLIANLDGSYILRASQRYQVTLTAVESVSEGYCIIKFEDRKFYYTVPKEAGKNASFTVIPSTDGKIEFMAVKGSGPVTVKDDEKNIVVVAP